LANVALENSLRARLVINPGHFELSHHCKTRGRQLRYDWKIFKTSRWLIGWQQITEEAPYI